MKEGEGKREKCTTIPEDRDWPIFEWFTRNKYVNNNNNNNKIYLLVVLFYTSISGFLIRLS
jgi:hypothetical protein